MGKFRPQAWWRLVDTKTGLIPLPVCLVLVALLASLTREGGIKADAPTMIACWCSAASPAPRSASVIRI